MSKDMTEFKPLTSLKGNKDTAGKPRLGLVPFKALKQISEVREFGINKYGNDDTNWKKVDKVEFIHAALRHIYKHLHEDKVDEESGLTHLAHATCSLVLAISLEDTNKEG